MRKGHQQIGNLWRLYQQARNVSRGRIFLVDARFTSARLITSTKLVTKNGHEPDGKVLSEPHRNAPGDVRNGQPHQQPSQLNQELCKFSFASTNAVSVFSTKRKKTTSLILSLDQMRLFSEIFKIVSYTEKGVSGLSKTP